MYSVFYLCNTFWFFLYRKVTNFLLLLFCVSVVTGYRVQCCIDKFLYSDMYSIEYQIKGKPFKRMFMHFSKFSFLNIECKSSIALSIKLYMVSLWHFVAHWVVRVTWKVFSIKRFFFVIPVNDDSVVDGFK